MEAFLIWIGRLFGISLETRKSLDEKPSLAEALPPPSETNRVDIPNPDLAAIQQQTCAPDLAVDFASFVDEIEISSRKNEDVSKHLLFVRDRLIEILAKHGIEVIEDQKWDKVRQRAIKLIPPDLSMEAAVVGESISCGVGIAGKVIKKQEVVLVARQGKLDDMTRPS